MKDTDKTDINEEGGASDEPLSGESANGAPNAEDTAAKSGGTDPRSGENIAPADESGGGKGASPSGTGASVSEKGASPSGTDASVSEKGPLRKSTAPKKEKRRGHKALIIVLSSVIAVLLLICAAAFVFISRYMNKVGRIDKSSVETVPPEDEVFEFEGFDTMPDDADSDDLPEDVRLLRPEDIEWSDISALDDDSLINILLVGNDYRDGYYTRRSDAIILCSINPESGRIALISFMRDMYVQIPGYSDNILNASFMFGGVPLLTQTLAKNFGVSIDGCLEVGLEQFMDVIDTVGGVDIQINEKEAQAIKAPGSGLVHMDGAMAKEYVSLRYIDSDFYRTERQRKVLGAIYDKAKGQSLAGLLDLADAALPSFVTDMSNTEILRILIKCYPLIGGTEPEMCRLPTYGSFENAVIRGMYVLVPDLEKCRADLEAFLPLD